MFELLARLRTRLGFVVGAAVLWFADPTPTSLVIGGAIAACGELLRVWAAGHLNKSREVTSSGPYRWLAHPLYVGSSVMGVGLAVASASIGATLLIAAYLGATIPAAIRTEEAFLVRRFGDEYWYRRQGVADSRRFSLARARANGEHRTIVGLVAVVLLLVLKATYNGLFWRAAGR